jgi:hypothetical protein
MLEVVIGRTGDVPSRPVIAIAVMWASFLGMVALMILERVCCIAERLKSPALRTGR